MTTIIEQKSEVCKSNNHHVLDMMVTTTPWLCNQVDCYWPTKKNIIVLSAVLIWKYLCTCHLYYRQVCSIKISPSIDELIYYIAIPTYVLEAWNDIEIFCNFIQMEEFIQIMNSVRTMYLALPEHNPLDVT